MAFLKQLIVTLVVLLAGTALWMAFDPRPGQVVLGMLPENAATLRGAVAAISASAPAGDAPHRIGATRLPDARGGTRPTIVVAGIVGEAVTRNRMQAIATGEAEHTVVVTPDSTGIVETVQFKSGDAVTAGSPLAVLENDTERLAVDRARIGLDAAEEKFQRYQRLAKSLAVTSVEVNDVARERDNARLDLRTAEVALAKRTIAAPLSGRVGIVSVEPGTLVSNQSVIATIDDRRRLRVIFYTPESFVNELSVGTDVEAVATARPETLYRGAISAIDSRLDEASRTLRTEALLDNASDELRPGMSFLITLKLAGKTLLAVDPLAVQWERDGAFVWKIVDARVEKSPVRIVERSIDRLLLTSTDLKKGDSVVVEGVQSVREGGAVEVRGVPEKPAAPAGENRNVPAAEGAPVAGGPDRADAAPAPAPASVPSDASRSAQARAGAIAR